MAGIGGGRRWPRWVGEPIWATTPLTFGIARPGRELVLAMARIGGSFPADPGYLISEGRLGIGAAYNQAAAANAGVGACGSQASSR